MRRILLIILSVLGTLAMRAKPPIQLSERSQVSVLTCGAGTELYSIFGHSAVRVYDPISGIDAVYNYGTFDFEAPNFALNFLKGKLTFWVAKTTYDRFLTEYYYTQRSVREQVLALDQSEKLQIFDFLEWNVKPANRSYQYDFYFDNCTTRIRDLLEEKLKLSYRDPGDVTKSFRDLLHENLDQYPWTRFGMDLILGTLSDSIADQRQQMFLPAYYYAHLDHAVKEDNVTVVNERQIILDFPLTSVSRNPWITPRMLFWGLFGLEMLFFLLYYVAGHKGRFKWHDKFWFVVLFMAFLVMISMWFFTDHEVCKSNWNILWTCPWMMLWFCTVPGSWTREALLWLTIAVMSAMLITWNVLPQKMDPAIIPLMLVSLMKALRRIGLIKWIDRMRSSMVAWTVIVPVGFSVLEF